MRAYLKYMWQEAKEDWMQFLVATLTFGILCGIVLGFEQSFSLYVPAFIGGVVGSKTMNYLKR